MIRNLIGIAVVLVAFGIVFTVLQSLWPAQRELRRTPREVATDFLYWLSTPLLSRPIARAAVVIALVPVLALLGRPLDRTALEHGYGLAAQLPASLQALLVVVLGDFFGYWTHRAFHRGRLWPFHAVHHGARELTWLAALRVHPVNDVIMRVVQAVPFIAAGFSPLVLGAYLPFLTFWAILLHANLRWDFGPLRCLFASPAFHRWHHADTPAARDRNFAGLFPLWDWLFGTLYLPRGEWPQTFGAHGETVPAGWFAQLLHPFRGRAAREAAAASLLQ